MFKIKTPHSRSVVSETRMSIMALILTNISKMLLCLFTLFSVTRIATGSSDYGIFKCCDSDSVFVKKNDTYICEESNNTRVSIQTNFILDHSEMQDSECVESVNSHLYLFKVKNNEPFLVEDVNRWVLPKCCPRNSSYVASTHSCRENHNNQFNSTFLKVGLPNCKVIYDYKMYSKDDFIVHRDYVYFPKLSEKASIGEYCIDETTENTFVARICKSYEFCEHVQCIHKCCSDGKSFVNGSHCMDTYVYGMDLGHLPILLASNSGDFAIVHGYNTGVYIPRSTNFYLDKRGNFHSYEEKIGNKIYSPEDETYCTEHATKNGIMYGHTLFRIIPQTVYLETKFLFNRWAMFISCVFLILTIIFYVVSNERTKVFGKILISFCIALFVLFVVLIYCTFNPNLNAQRTMAICKSIGFLLIYMSFSCFAWLQIMCYDIYWTFGSTKRFSTKDEKPRRDFKRFLFYSLYGWGFPLIMMLIPLIFHFADVLPAPIKVRVAETKCLIERGDGNYAELLFYISPLTIIELSNVVFFVKTIRYCLQVKGDIQKMNKSADLQKKKNKFVARKERFSLIIKLSIIMGIFFLFEVVSSFYDFKENTVTEYVEIVWDVFNCSQGVFIFIIFICKKKNLKKCRKNITVEKLRKISLSSTSTKTTGLSSVKKSQDNRRKYSREERRNKFA